MDPVSSEAFREAMASLAAAVCVVTTDGPAGRYGMTATACCPVSDEPATMLVCVNRGSRGHGRFERNGHMAVNVLAESHKQVADAFAGRLGGSLEDRFASACWTEPAGWGGSPVLADALSSVWGRITGRADVGTHTVFYVQVEGCLQGDARGDCRPLAYLRRQYHCLAPATPSPPTRPRRPIRMEDVELAARLSGTAGWDLRAGKLYRRFAFGSFEQALAFMNQVAGVAGRLNHHPHWINDHDVVEVHLSTLDVGGISALDFELAVAMNEAFDAFGPQARLCAA